MTIRPKLLEPRTVSMARRIVCLFPLLIMSVAAPAQAQRPQGETPFHLLEATIDGIQAELRSGRLTCTQLVQSYLDRIAAYDQTGPTLNAVQNVNPRALKSAADMAAVGIGEDTGGSIRGPASHASLVGLRPTLPLVSRAGMMPFSPTRDTLGPITRTVRDMAILLDVIAGYDPEDPITAWSYGQKPKTYTSFLVANGLAGMRL